MASKKRTDRILEAPVGPRLQRILIGTDFSAGSRAALNRVARLPLEARAEIILAYVIPAGGDLFVDRGAESAVQQLLEDEARVLRRLLPKSKVRPELARGRPVQALFELGKKLEPELVVLGRHGEHRMRDELLGSTAERVLQLANRPVLVVSRPPRSGYKSVVAAVDLEPGSVEILVAGLRIVGATAKQVALVHAIRERLPSAVKGARKAGAEEVARAEGRLAAELQPFPGLTEAATIVIGRGDPRQVLMKQVAAQNADLLVVGTHGRSGAELALMGSVAQSLSRRAPCDVLVIPTPILE